MKVRLRTGGRVFDLPVEPEDFQHGVEVEAVIETYDVVVPWKADDVNEAG